MEIIASVIVPTHKRFDAFCRCIESLLVQDFDPERFEVIAIHDGHDHGYDMEKISEWRRRSNNFHFVPIAKGGACQARNEGIKRGRGRYVFMTDDDCVADEQWIRKLVEFLDSHDDVVAAGGQVLAVPPRTFVQEYIKFKNLLRRPVRNINGEIVTLVTANVCYRKSVLERIGVFSHRFKECGIHYGGEDLDLAFRALKVGKLGYCEDAVVYHDHRSSVSALASQHFMYGRGVYTACRDNGIRYEDLRFSLPRWYNAARHLCLSTSRLMTISIPEYREKKLSLRKYPPYFFLDLLRRNVFMWGACYEYYKQRKREQKNEKKRKIEYSGGERRQGRQNVRYRGEGAASKASK
jgi:GT2 family glycosyltransferase